MTLDTMDRIIIRPMTCAAHGEDRCETPIAFIGEVSMGTLDGAPHATCEFPEVVAGMEVVAMVRRTGNLLEVAVLVTPPGVGRSCAVRPRRSTCTVRCFDGPHISCGVVWIDARHPEAACEETT